MRGMVFGSALLLLFPEVFRFLNEWRFVIYGLLLVFMMQFRPQGNYPDGSLPFLTSLQNKLKRSSENLKLIKTTVVTSKGKGVNKMGFLNVEKSLCNLEVFSLLRILVFMLTKVRLLA